MKVINNEKFINMNVAAMCYYQDRYKNLNKKRIPPEQIIIDNLDLYYGFDGKVTLNEFIDLATGNHDSSNSSKFVKAEFPKTIEYEGLLKFNKTAIHEGFIKNIYLQNKENLFVTTQYSNLDFSNDENNLPVLDFQEADENYYRFYNHNIYIKLADLTDFSVTHGLNLNDDFYAPILINSYEFSNYIESINQPDISTSDIIDCRDQLIHSTAFITNSLDPFIITNTVNNSVRQCSNKVEHLKDIIFHEHFIGTEIPDLDDLKEMLLAKLNNHKQEEYVKTKVQEAELILQKASDNSAEINLFSEIKHTSENLELLKRVVIEFWEHKDPNQAAKQATNDVIKAWVKENSPKTSPTLAKNIAMIVRPNKYK